MSLQGIIGLKVYLGDSVYATFDGYHVILTTENGYPDDPRNKIYLEDSVLNALHNFVQAIREERTAHHESQS